jgi:hypothetical protein
LEPSYPKYDEQIKQGFTEPCFFVQQIDGSQQREVGRRYRRMLLFNTMFFPDPDSLIEKSVCQAMAERLYEKLEYIVWDGITYRGLRLRHEVIDDVLHFFMSFDIHLLRERPVAPKMQTIEQEEHLK